MKRHQWDKPRPRPPGAIEVCVVCGAIRITAIPGYRKSPAMLSGKTQRYCPGRADYPLGVGVGVGAPLKPNQPTLSASVTVKQPSSPTG